MSNYNNRRRLLDNSDAFRNTGVPCGNPKRYECQDVMRMDSGKRKFGDEDDLETQGEKQLQVMAKKQLNTKMTLDEQISQHRSFASSGAYKPSIKTLSGVSKLENYRDILEKDSAVEELRKCGLTEEEIRLKLGNVDRDRKHHYGVDPESQSRSLEEIDRKINERLNSDQQTSGTQIGVRVMGRRELEIEHRLTGGNSQARALSDFLTRRKVISGDLDDPLNKLPEILKDIERKGHEKKGRRRKSPSSIGRTVELNDEGSEEFIGPLLPGEERNPAIERVTDPSPLEVEKKEVLTVNKDGRRVVIETVEHIPEDVIKKYRLNVDDIRALPRFENYAPGAPNKTLFLKNLSNKVAEEDLVSLFGRFQKTEHQKIVYRLMSGRMRGQAFVTFHDSHTASLALELVNGYQFRGKPIIIQYGKR